MTQVSRLAIVGSLALWAAGIVFGTRYANNYSGTPGISSPSVDHWPTHSLLALSSTRDTIVIAIHPQCPCSNASVEELRNAVARSGEHPLIYALIYQPNNEPADWAETPVVRAAQAIPGSHIFIDRTGSEMERFHARVSGDVFLYDVEGRIRFKGGVTSSRGNVGESGGGVALTALLRHENLPVTHTPVFGCSLVRSPGVTEAGKP